MYTVYYTGEFQAIERSERPLDGVVDIWLRKNPRTTEDSMNSADEVYAVFNINQAPSQSDLESNFDYWFETIDKMSSGKSSDELQIDELTNLLYTILGVTKDA